METRQTDTVHKTTLVRVIPIQLERDETGIKRTSGNPFNTWNSLFQIESMLIELVMTRVTKLELIPSRIYFHN